MTKQHDQLLVAQGKNSNDSNETGLSNNRFLTDEETKKVLTPFAFKIDESLFGLPLALPWRRGLALLIDLILIAILSSAPGELLAIVVAMTFYKLGSANKHNKVGRLKQLSRIAFRILGAFIIFVVLIDTLPNLFDEPLEGTDKKPTASKVIANNDKSLGWAEGLALGALSTSTYQQIMASTCEEVHCWQSELLPFVEQLPAFTQDDETVQALIETMVATIDEKQKIAKGSQKELEQYFFNQYLTLKTNLIDAKPLTPDKHSQIKAETAEIATESTEDEGVESLSESNSTGYKGLEWLNGIINDLGLGFGWAAFYFTVLTSIWRGQTPGKKLFKIRVVQLDGSKLSLWDSFGRYGGYGAGLATGLLGFFQIYWDPNRQAIHDKISATVVIDVTLFEKRQAGNVNKSSV